MNRTSADWSAILPREHGAWSLLLLPFASAVVLLEAWRAEVVAGLVLVLCLLLLRGPLIVLARQRWVWRVEKPETALARVAVWSLGGVAALAAVPMLWVVPLELLVAMGAGAGGFLAAGTWLAVKNRQHSVVFQTASAVALTGSAVVPGLVVGGTVPVVVLWLWALQAVHAAAAIPLVHARLALRRGQPAGVSAAAGVGVSLVMAAGLMGLGYGKPGVAVAVGALVQAVEFWMLHRPGAAKANLHQLGLRLMGESILFSGLVVWTLWVS